MHRQRIANGGTLGVPQGYLNMPNMPGLKQKLTKSLINNVQPGTEEIIVRDTEVVGLALRVTVNGAKSFFIRYRLGRGRGAPVRKPTIGRVSDLTVEQAREIARDWKAKGKQGVDAAQAQREEASSPTIKRMCDDYMSRHGNAKRTASEDQRRIDKIILPRIGRMRVKDVTHADIADLHRSMKDRPYEGNRVLALLSKMFSLSIRWRWIEINPALRTPEQ